MSYITLPTFGASPYWANAVADASALPATGDVTGQVVLVLDTASLYYWDGDSWEQLVDGLANVSGPASSTDNAVVRFDGTTGKILKNSAVTIDNSGNIATAGTVDGVDVSTLPGLIDAKITGPGSATDNAVVRYDLTTGKLAQNSGVTIDDSNNVESVARLNASTAKVGGTGANTAGVTLEVAGTTGAFMPPKLTDAQRNALTPVAGMMLYNTTSDRLEVYLGGSVATWVAFPGWGN